MRIRFIFGGITLLFAVSASWAQPLGTAITYQGRLDDNGQPFNGAADLVFRLYDGAAGGSLLGSQTLSGVAISDGLFSVTLNAAGEFGVTAFNGDRRWLEISVNGVTLLPRQELTAAPYSLGLRMPFSGGAAVDGGAVVEVTNTGTAIGSCAIKGAGSTSGQTIAILGETNSGNGTAIQGSAHAPAGPTIGVFGSSDSSSGIGVRGSSTAVSGITYGGYFDSASSNGRGVWGVNSATTGSAFGVIGQSGSTTGNGVYGWAHSGSGTNYGVRGITLSPSGYGVFGEGPFTGVFGTASGTSGSTSGGRFASASPNGSGVFASNSASTGIAFGGQFESASTSGRALSGSSTSFTGQTVGVSASVNSPSGWALSAGGGIIAVRGATFELDATGVLGWTRSISGMSTGVEGLAESDEGTGVLGDSTSETGITNGVWGTCSSPQGVAVYAVGRHPESIGVWAQNPGSAYGVYGASSSGRGVFGSAGYPTGPNYGVYGQSSSTSGRGVYGNITATTGTSYAIRGSNSSSSGYAVYAAGNLACTGNKSFVIDHPLDPENRYLKHYCSEGPEPLNVYGGIVVLGTDGGANIKLPDYFASINRDPRYSLTPISAAMPNLHIEQEIDVKSLASGEQCMFRVAGGKPGARVSWEVKAIRNDAWVRTYGAPVEVEKDDEERGKYQHPELYGQPPKKAIDFISKQDQERMNRRPLSRPSFDSQQQSN